MIASHQQQGGRVKTLLEFSIFHKKKEKANAFMHVIKAIELKSPLVERHGIRKMGSRRNDGAKAVTY